MAAANDTAAGDSLGTDHIPAAPTDDAGVNNEMAAVSSPLQTRGKSRKPKPSKLKFVHLLGFPLAIPLIVDEMHRLLKERHAAQRRSYKITVMFPTIFRYTGNSDFAENIQPPVAGASDEENTGGAIADDVYKYGSNNSYILRDGLHLIAS